MCSRVMVNRMRGRSLHRLRSCCGRTMFAPAVMRMPIVIFGGMRAEGELPEEQEWPLWSAPPYGMGSMYAELLK